MLLWNSITLDSKPSSFPSDVKQAGVFLADIDKTFTTKGDAMPDNGFNLGFARTKYIHSVGTVGKVKFVSNGKHEFSGIFKGADYGLIRMSVAVKPGGS